MKFSTLWQFAGPAIKATAGAVAFLVGIGWGAAIAIKVLAHDEAIAATKPLQEQVLGLEKRHDDMIKANEYRMNSIDDKLNILINSKLNPGG